MNNKKKWFLMLGALVVLVAGGVLLYNALYQSPGSLVTPPVSLSDDVSVSADAAPSDSVSVSDAATPTGDESSSDDKSPGGRVTDSNSPAPSDDSANTESPPPAGQSTALANFTVTDRDGAKVRLSDLHDKPVVLNFWASWCPPCKAELPALEAAYLDYGSDIHFMMVDLTDGMRETESSARDYIDGQGYTFPIYFDTEGDAAYAYNIMSIPTTYFISADGRIISSQIGMLDEDTLAEKLDELLGS